jgi:cytochrome c biogenesis factor
MANKHTSHPWIEQRKRQGPHLTKHENLGFNGKIAVLITRVVGTIWCAYVFTGIAFVALPQAIQAGSLIVLVNWLSSNFLQLVLLPIIIVGQNILAKASDKQAEQTFKDAEAILQLQDEVHRLIEINNDLTEAIHATVVKENFEKSI